ncbi:MAG: hypothetical protein IID16_01085, partial [Candidatus Marinimicrobia bacterium]|nr:hypothetical protein [Candidatus Neomarinimicrobiota bacterium]
MDTFSHTLWGYGLFGYRGRPWIAVIFGAMPDLVSFGPFLVIRILSGTIEPGPPPLEIIPGWVSMNYNFSHSFVIAFLSIGIVAIFSKSMMVTSPNPISLVGPASPNLNSASSNTMSHSTSTLPGGG